MASKPPSSSAHHDLLILGAGPGGYVAAIRGAQLGLNTAIVDKEKALGGTCLRVGCIPSKALLESSHLYHEVRETSASHGVVAQNVELDLSAMMKRKTKVVQTLTGGVASLMKKNKVTVYHGTAAFTDAHTVAVGDQTLTADHILIATGSVPTSLPGVDLSQDRIDTSTDAIAYDTVPETLVVIGAGYIGIELGSVWNRLGSKVIVLEYLDRVLPGMDREVADEAEKIFRKQGLDFRLGTKVTGVETTKKGVKVLVADGDPVLADRVLVAVGRKPNTQGLGLEKAGVEMDERGRVKIDKHFKNIRARRVRHR